ncbi:MAG TPA: Dabb family protein [Planctomycetaceae bacterium]|nr:Dabb family protein [Planctomycetaceae bacterium]
MTKMRAILTMAAILISGASASAQLKDGETIVFLGDSITQQGAGPKGYVTLFREAIEKSRPDSGIKVIGAGIGGHKVPNLEARLDKDVLAHKPNVVVIYIGINDVWHSERGQGTEIGAYETGLRSLVKRCNDAGARVILSTPSVIDEKTDGTNSLDKILDEYSDVSRKVAMETGSTLLDLRAAVMTYLKEYNTANEAKGILTGDGVHLNDAGNRFVAVRMLEAAGEVKARTPELRHVVIFKFKPEVTAAQLDEINREFQNLKNAIPEVKDFERGINNSPEGLNKGFTHCYVITFASETDRDAYLPHPAHKKFVELIGGKLEEPFVFDYWTVE